MIYGSDRFNSLVIIDDLPEDLAEYVLSDFKKDEISKIGDAVKKAADACEHWIKEGIDKTRNLYNKAGD